jgi:hypothetical protein
MMDRRRPLLQHVHFTYAVVLMMPLPYTTGSTIYSTDFLLLAHAARTTGFWIAHRNITAYSSAEVSFSSPVESRSTSARLV